MIEGGAMNDSHVILLWVLLMTVLALASICILLGARAASRWADAGNFGGLLGLMGLIVGTPFLWFLLEVLPRVSEAHHALLGP